MGSKSPAFKGRASHLTRELCNIRANCDFRFRNIATYSVGYNHGRRINDLTESRAKCAERIECHSGCADPEVVSALLWRGSFPIILKLSLSAGAVVAKLPLCQGNLCFRGGSSVLWLLYKPGFGNVAGNFARPEFACDRQQRPGQSICPRGEDIAGRIRPTRVTKRTILKPVSFDPLAVGSSSQH